MSSETKKIVTETKEVFRKLVEQADGAEKRVEKLDKDLATKIRKVKENASEVVKHIEEKSK